MVSRLFHYDLVVMNVVLQLGFQFVIEVDKRELYYKSLLDLGAVN